MQAVYQHGCPYILGFHVGVCHENSDAHNSNITGQNELNGGVPRLFRGQYRQKNRLMPQLPQEAKHKHAFDEAKLFLQQWLEIAAPAVFLVKLDGGKDKAAEEGSQGELLQQKNGVP